MFLILPRHYSHDIRGMFGKATRSDSAMWIENVSYPHFGDNSVDSRVGYPQYGDNHVHNMGITEWT